MIPPSLSPLFRACRDAGGRALLVGGTVRDALLGSPGKDLDIEVHGLPLDAVLAVLRRFGQVNEVGRAFGVLKLRVEGLELDVSLPRRDTRAGVGHKGIRATADRVLITSRTILTSKGSVFSRAMDRVTASPGGPRINLTASETDMPITDWLLTAVM